MPGWHEGPRAVQRRSKGKPELRAASPILAPTRRSMIQRRDPECSASDRAEPA